MTKHILFDERGKMLARYDASMHAQIPKSAIKVSDELFMRTVQEADGEWRLSDSGAIEKHASIYEPTDDDHRAAVAAERYKRETAGITLQGMQIDTGRDSQALITGATVQAMLDPSYSLRWKTPVGFVEMTAEQIIGVASAARAHVQACFDREADLLDAIAAGTYTAAMLEEGWP